VALYIAGVSADGTYFVDQNNNPRLFVGEDCWDVIVNGGRWNGGDSSADFNAYTSSRAGQGFTATEVNMFSSNNANASYAFTDGRDWDGAWPFNGSTDPTTTANEVFWSKRDYFFDACQAQGITVVMNLTTAALATTWIRSWTTGQWTAYGSFIGARYASQPNILWIVGDDYFGDMDTGLNAMLTAMRSAGDTHPMSIQNYQETTSRQDIYDGTKDPLTFDVHAQYHWVYTYNVSYIGVIDACVTTPSASDDVQGRIPALWADGVYYGDALPGGNHQPQMHRNLVWWALSSGACGFSVGGNGVWQWTSASPGYVTSDPTGTFMTSIVGKIVSLFAGLTGWQKLRPDTANALVTSGRGSQSAPLVSGGSAVAYTGTSDAYVTAAFAADGSLAVIYMSHAATITINQAKMTPGYGAYWVDPQTGVKTSTTAGSSYNSASPGSNSAGEADWVLVLAAPPYATWTVP
jgi:Protein of unknown function (DUF4038)/Putative collagen-binding domain of a collagenase